MMQRTERLSEECRLTAMGLRLRHAREALQISESSAAEQLFLSVGQVRALEDAHYEQLPAEVFVRGYLRSYARLLGLDPDDILRQYNPGDGASLGSVAGAREETLASTPAEPVGIAGRPGASSVGSLGTAANPAAQSVSWRDRCQGLLKPGTKKLEEISDTTLMALSGVAIVLVMGTVAALLFFGGGRSTEPLAANSVKDGSLAGQALVVDSDLFQVMEDATRLEVNLPSVSGVEPSDDASLQSSEQDLASVVDPVAAADSGVLELEFSADCWVEVKDSSRNILLADMRRAGDREVFNGEPPYKVLLGRADAVVIRFGGKRFPVKVDDGKDYTRVVIGG